MEKSKSIVSALSIIPGMAHLYLGLMKRGLQFLIIFFGIIFLSYELLGSLFFFTPVVVIYAFFDVHNFYNILAVDEDIYDVPLFLKSEINNYQHIIGWMLIIVGLLSIMKIVISFLPYSVAVNIPFDLIQHGTIVAIILFFGLKFVVTREKSRF